MRTAVFVAQIGVRRLSRRLHEKAEILRHLFGKRSERTRVERSVEIPVKTDRFEDRILRVSTQAKRRKRF